VKIPDDFPVILAPDWGDTMVWLLNGVQFLPLKEISREIKEEIVRWVYIRKRECVEPKFLGLNERYESPGPFFTLS